ncbi:hypothetical protein HY345_04185 [Candidatus Microgenomates bacterium]|nr:hypothetical protein [Candidatus Microgenomates bacterium]
MKTSPVSLRELLLVILYSSAATIFTTINFFSQLLNIPPGRTFIGMTHYWIDFYYYLDQFWQGAHNSFSVINKFTPEYYPPMFGYVNHLVLGKIGSLLGLETFATYNLSLILLKFLFFFLSYFFLRQVFEKNIQLRITALCLFVFATSYPLVREDELGTFFEPIRLFRAKNTISTRFGTIPQHVVTDILSLVTLWLMFDFLKKARTKIAFAYNNLTEIINNLKKNFLTLFSLSFTLTLLTLSDPAKSVTRIIPFAIAVMAGSYKRNVKFDLVSRGLILLIVFLPSVFLALLLKEQLSQQPLIQQANLWDIENHKRQVYSLLHNLPYLFMSVGPILIPLLFLFGYVKKIFSRGEFFFLFLVLLTSVLGFVLPIWTIAPIPGFRFLSGISYLILAIFGAYGTYKIKQLLRLNTVFIPLLIFVSLSLLTFIPSLVNRLQPPLEPDFTLTYPTNDTYRGLKILEKLPSEKSIVLSSPYSYYYLMIPGLTGKVSFYAHFLLTKDFYQKEAKALRFFYQWGDAKLGSDFLHNNNIEYVVYAREKRDIKKTYPFLRVIFEGEKIGIYRVD